MGIEKHWETVYRTKSPDQLSWTEQKPQTSLDLIRSFGLDKTAKIIDVGGGDSNLVDCLLNEGFEHITVLDISAKALQKTRDRLGDRAKKVNWIVGDITEFEPWETYDVWHDRAMLHFLTSQGQIEKYKELVNRATSGFVVLGAFSKNGPTQCSGLEILQYDEEKMENLLKDGFDRMECIHKDHNTPFGTTQNFIFCSFKKRTARSKVEN